MRKLLLIRHSQSAVTPDLAPSRWPLSEEGRRLCRPFAPVIAGWKPTIIITSEEEKALETGLLIGQALRLPVESRPGLHEHVRPAFQQPDSPEVFRNKVARLFDHPEDLVFGEETASQALARFESAVMDVLGSCAGTVGIVTHGTVMALFVGKHNSVDVTSFWRSLAMPHLIVLEAGSFRWVNAGE